MPMGPAQHLHDGSRTGASESDGWLDFRPGGTARVQRLVRAHERCTKRTRTTRTRSRSRATDRTESVSRSEVIGLLV